MSRTIRVYYSKIHNLHGRCRMNFNWPPITQQSVVLISAAEATDLTQMIDPAALAAEVADHNPGVLGAEAADRIPIIAPPPNFGFILGDADVFVTNVSPHQGGVEFILHVNWASALNIVVDISVFDPAEQFLVA